MLELKFENSLVVLYDSNTDSQLLFTFSTALFSVSLEEFKNMELVKQKESKYSDSNYLFMEFE